MDDRLAACGHNIAAIRSIYRWQGATRDEHEARVALHTRAELVPAIVQRADVEHPYEVLCVIATPVLAGNPAYVQWVLGETGAMLNTCGSIGKGRAFTMIVQVSSMADVGSSVGKTPPTRSSRRLPPSGTAPA